MRTSYLLFCAGGMSLVTLGLSSRSAQAQLRAFGEAEGFGAVATGARAVAGPTIYHVTNLNNSGAGSFRDAVSADNRIVVFDVGGVINLTSEVGIQSNITIAGQTAPGGGIMITGAEVSMGSQTNIIMRYLRFRPGDSTANTDNGLNLYNAGSVTLDHISIAFAKWNNIDSVTDKGYFTIQNSIIADPINQQFNAHMESLQGPVTWSNNLFANAHNRNPLAKMDTVFKNNILYNDAAGYTVANTSGHFNHDIINNYFIAGPGSSAGNQYFQFNANQSIFSRGNVFDSNRNSTLDGSTINPPSAAIDLTAPWSPGTATLPTLSAADAFAFVTNHAGASITRDSLDQLVINQTRTLGNGVAGTGAGTAGPDGGMYNHATDTGLANGGLGAIASATRPAGFDSDNDGIPDAWETAHGLNPSNPSDALLRDPLGYFMLEKYVNELGAVNDSRTWTAPAGNWSTGANWTGAAAPGVYDYAAIRGSGAANAAVTVNAGTASALTLTLGGNGPAAGESLTVSGGKLDVYDTITVGELNNATLTISGGGTVDAYNLVLGNSVFAPSASTFIGTLNLSGGTLALAQLARGGGTPGNWNGGSVVNFSGGTLKAVADLVVSAPMTLTNAPSIDTDGHNGTMSGVLSGPGGFIKKGAGTLLLGALNTFTGPLTIQAGAVAVAALSNGDVPGNLGAGAVDPADLTLDSGTLLFQATAATSTNRLFTLGPGGATLDNSGNAGVGFTGAGQLAVTGAGNRTLTLTGAHYNANGNDSFSPGVSDPAGGTTTLVKSGSGRWFISGTPKTYSGDTVINGGDLYADTANVLPFGAGKGNVVLNAGRLYIYSGGLNINGLNGAGGAVDSNGGKALTLGYADADGSFDGNINGGINLTKTGAGTQALNGTANAYSGSTTVNNGVLLFANAVGGGAAANLTVNADATMALGFAPPQTLLARVTPASTGVFALAADSPVSLDFSASGANLPNVLLGAVGLAHFSGTLTPGSGGYRLGGGGGTLVISAPNALSGAANVIIGSTGSTGGGFVSVATTQNYSGTTTLRARSTLLAYAANGGLPSGLGVSSSDAGNVVLDGGTLEMTGATDRLFTLTAGGGAVDNTAAGGFSNAGAIVVPAGADAALTLTGGNTGHIAFSPALADAGGGVVTSVNKTGGGKWTFNVSNNKTYTGDTHVLAGTLESLGTNVFSKFSNLVIDPAAALELHGYSNTINALSGAGAVYNSFGHAADSLTVGFAGGSGVFTGSLASGLQLIKAGTGTQTLGGSPRLLGPVVVSAGTLRLNASAELPALTLAETGATFAGTLDVTDARLIVETNPALPTDKPAQAALLQTALLAGFHGGDYLGAGITSSTVAASNAGSAHAWTLALFDNADLQLSALDTLPMDANSLLVTTALVADANLDNLCNAADFNIWYAHALQYQPAQSAGDFNHDGVVDGRDFDLWYAAAGASAQPTLDALALNRTVLSALRVAPVPEPSSALLLLTLAPLLTRRHRRSASRFALRPHAAWVEIRGQNS